MGGLTLFEEKEKGHMRPEHGKETSGHGKHTEDHRKEVRWVETHFFLEDVIMNPYSLEANNLCKTVFLKVYHC